MPRAIAYLRRHHVALFALLVACGGTSYAAARFPANSVGSSAIKRNAVIRAKIHANAVNSAKVADHSLLAKDFKAGQLPTGAPGAKGPAGARGATGATGGTGPQGVPGPTASAFATTDKVVSILGSGPIPVISLSSADIHNIFDTGTHSTGKLQVGFPARVILDATATITMTGSWTADGQCQIEVISAQGAPTQAGQTVFFPMQGQTDNVHVTGGVDLAPGTYDAELECVAVTGGTLTVAESYRSDITAVAAAR